MHSDTFILFSYVFLKVFNFFFNVFLFINLILFIFSSFYFVSHYNIVYTLTLLTNPTKRSTLYATHILPISLPIFVSRTETRLRNLQVEIRN